LVEVTELQDLQREAIGSEPVGGDRLRPNGLVPDQLCKELKGRPRVPARRHHEVKNLAFVIDRATEIHAPGTNLADHQVEAPPRRRRRLFPPQILGDLRSELDRPAANGLVAHLDPAMGEQFLDVPKAHREAEIEPDGVADDIGGESVPLE
jgi:hypothetical protein